MPRNANQTLQCAYEDFRENCVTLSDNELMPYKILTMPTSMNLYEYFISINLVLRIYRVFVRHKRKRERETRL